MRVLAPSPERLGLLARSRMRQASLPRLLYGALVASAAAYVVAFIGTALFRLSYPFPLEINEPAVLREVEAILHRQPLYAAPAFQHVPLIYGPAYFYASAGLALLTGPSYLPMRLVSLLASVGSLIVVARLVHLETSSMGAGVIAAGLLAATYPMAQTALDLGRVDALFLFLLLAGIGVVFTETRRAQPRALVLGASGILIGLAGLSKLPMGAVPVAVALSIYLGVTVRWRVLAFIFGFAASVGVVLALLRLQSGDWPAWYIVYLPSQHAIEQKYLGRFWFNDLLPRLTLPFLLGPVFVLGRLLRGQRRALLFWGLAAPALLGLAWASRTNTGGSTNVLLPALAAVALLLGLGLHETRRQLGDGSPRARAFQSYALGLCLVQFALLAYNPRLLVPYRSDEWADERLAARLASLPGSIFAPDLDGYLRGSDKGEQPLMGAVGELNAGYGETRTPEGAAWTAELDADLKSRRFSYVVLYAGECCLSELVLRDGYVDVGPLFPPDDEFWLWKTTHTPEVRLYAAPSA